MTPVIEARGLRKRYGDLVAVDGVEFSVAAGEIFGLLGPNGAGKTTTLEMLEGLRDPDEGDARVFGAEMRSDAGTLKQRIGVQLQATALPAFTRVAEAVELFAAFYPRARATDELLAEFDLSDRASAYCDRLSGGQQQRLSLALALVNMPELVFLDEPTTGLDPSARISLWGVIERIRDEGTTVVLTTHYMEEAERLCDRVAVMDRGRIVALDTPARLVAEHAPGATIEFDLPGADAQMAARLPGADSVEVRGDHVRLRTRSPERVLQSLFDPATAAALAGGRGGGVAAAAAVGDLRVRSGTLEDVFLALTGRSLESA